MKSEMSTRAIWAMISTTLEELAIYLVITEFLPNYGWEAPLWLTIIIMAVWFVVSITIYRAGSRALKKKPLGGLSSMVGSKGIVIRALNPNGLVRIKSELWAATSRSGEIAEGSEVEVLSQEKMQLFVKKSA